MQRLLRCVLLGSTIVWAGVIMATALSIPESFAKLVPILGGGVAAHLIMLGSAVQRAGKDGS